MKICPVCNDSFADELNFCDIDGVRLTRQGGAQERNKWWSFVGAGLLIGAVVITAASIFLPRSRLTTPVATPVAASEPQQAPAPTKPPAIETAPAVAVSTEPRPEPERAANDIVAPDVKKKDNSLTKGDSGPSVPNPKAAAIASEVTEKDRAAESKKAEPPAPKSLDAPPTARIPHDAKAAEPIKPAQPPDLKSERQPQPASSKSKEKAGADKKKSDDKDKKKGGFLKVFKKIFGKG